VPAYALGSPWELPRWIKPAIAGLVVGIVGVFLPQLFGVGYETIGAILNGQVTAFWLLAALMLAKLMLTPISIGGGFQGGVFAPSLFIGASLGALYADGLAAVFPGLNLTPGAFAMVGMAAVLAGAVHAPLTAVILLFEMTNDYRIILPLMFAVLVSLVISQKLVRDSVYTLGLARKGIRLERGRDVDVLEMIIVGEVMQPAPLLLAESDSLRQAADTLLENRHHGLPVVNGQGELVGILTTQHLAGLENDGDALRVGDVCTRDLITAFPDETIGAVLQRMGAQDIGRVPVVVRENPRRLAGWLRRSDLLRAYEVALTRQVVKRHRVHQVRLDAVSGENVRVFEIPIETGAACDGKKVKEIGWPPNCLLATVLAAGNTLVVVVEGGSEEDVACLCRAGGEPETMD
jgi:CIC family chloride channel protein